MERPPRSKPRRFDGPRPDTTRAKYAHHFYDECACGARKDKRASACKACHKQQRQAERDSKKEARQLRQNQRARESYARNVEVRRAAARRDYAKHRDERLDAMRESRLKRLYGITSEERDQLRAEWNDCCPLCLKPLGAGHRAHTDHDHDTKRVRGVVCIKCNHALGVLGDNEAGLLRALAYVRGELRPDVVR